MMALRLHLLSFLIALSCLTSRGTEFGFMVTGSTLPITNALARVSGSPGISWIRGLPQPGYETDFRWVQLLHYYIGQGHRTRPEILPEDLFAIRHAARTHLPSVADQVAAWEAWNEPDFYFVANNASDMAAALKAAWWGVKSTLPQAQVLMPSLAFRPGRYALELAHNGLASYTDGYNLHYYGWAADYPDFLEHHRVFTEAAGMDQPWWLTEMGYFQLSRSQATDPDALARQSAFHERVMFESWVAGVDRHLAFILSPYGEGASDLGFLDAQGHPRPVLSAFQDLASRLPGYQPLHSWNLSPTGERMGLTLQHPEHGYWTVLWSPGRPRESFPTGLKDVVSAPEQLRLGMRWDKNETEIGTGRRGEVLLHPDQARDVELNPARVVHFHSQQPPRSVHGARRSAVGPLHGRGPRVSPVLQRELATLPPRREPSPVVVRWALVTPATAHKPRQTWRVPTEEPVQANLEFWNLGETPLSGTWQVEVPRGWRIPDIHRAAPLVNPTGVITLAAGQRQVVPLSLQAVKANGAGEIGIGRFTATWRGAEGSVDVASIRLESSDGSLADPWHRFGWRDFQPRSGHPEAWQVFDTGSNTFSLEVRETAGDLRDAMIQWRLPRGATSEDVLQLTLRLVSAGGPAFGQLFLVTDGGEVWRYDEWSEVGREGREWQVRLGDGGPTIWSRARTWGEPEVGKGRWLLLRLQGLEPGMVFEGTLPALSRGR